MTFVMSRRVFQEMLFGPENWKITVRRSDGICAELTLSRRVWYNF